MNPVNHLAMAGGLGAHFRKLLDREARRGLSVPIGNRSCSKEAQAELILLAQQKRDRKAQKRLGQVA